MIGQPIEFAGCLADAEAYSMWADRAPRALWR